MQYGFFDDECKEYVITRPDTPRSWTNYLGDSEFCSIITNNAGGYAFYKSAAQGRFMRARLNAIPMDQPGRYLYIRDQEKFDFWSASWQPVAKPLELYRSKCRFGSAYTVIESEYDRIRTETTYFVPLGESFEVWKIKITNDDSQHRKLSLFTFVEYAGNWNAVDDLVNLQYTQYTVQMKAIDGVIDHGTNVFMPTDPDNFQNKDQGRHTFMAIAGVKTKGFDTDRDAFIGPYRNYSNPIVVEKGQCKNSLGSGDNGCGTHQIDLELKPGETKAFAVIVGIGRGEKEGKMAQSAYGDMAVVDSQLDKLKKFWHKKIEGLTVSTPSKSFDSMMNMWNPYNNLITFSLSRIASLVYNGERDGLGYRDTVQDCMGIIHNIPGEVKKKLELMLSGQCSTGGALPVVKPFAHNPGNEKVPKENDYRSDDCLWLFPAIQQLVKETGDLAFFKTVIPYADRGEDTVLNHLKRAIEFSIQRSGNNGFPCGLHADWNDCLQLGPDGESIFVALQLRLALTIYSEICELEHNETEIVWSQNILAELDKRLQTIAWDGNWYIRALRKDGFKFGSSENIEGKIFLNTQSWAILSGHADPHRAALAMESVNRYLATEFGLQICHPSFEKTDFNIVKAILFNKGMKENGGIFNHTQGWAVMAEAILGNGNRAFQYYLAHLPSNYNEIADTREVEPYVHCQSIHGRDSSRFGRGRVSWLSGTATWAYYSAAQYILGIQPEYNGIIINPCVPDSWKEFYAKRRFRGKELRITYKNPDGIEKGVRSIHVNGVEIVGTMIPFEVLKEVNEIQVYMGL